MHIFIYVQVLLINVHIHTHIIRICISSSYGRNWSSMCASYPLLAQVIQFQWPQVTLLRCIIRICIRLWIWMCMHMQTYNDVHLHARKYKLDVWFFMMFSVGNILSLGVFSFWGEFLYFAQTSKRPWTFCEGSRFTMPFPICQVVFGSWMTTFLSNRAIQVLSSSDVSLIITSEPLWVPWPHFTANNWRLSTFEVANLV